MANGVCNDPGHEACPPGEIPPPRGALGNFLTERLLSGISFLHILGLALHRQQPLHVFHNALGIDDKKNPFPIMIGRCSIVVFLRTRRQFVADLFHFRPLFRTENHQDCQMVLFRDQGTE